MLRKLKAIISQASLLAQHIKYLYNTAWPRIGIPVIWSFMHFQLRTFSTQICLFAPKILTDMRKKTNYYSVFSVKFNKQNYLDAAQLLSAYNNTQNEIPAVAAIENAIIFPEGQVANKSISFNGKGCKSPSARFKTFHKNFSSYQQNSIMITIADYWGENYFHFVAENFVKMPLVFQVLQHFPQTKIHVRKKQSFVTSWLQLFELNKIEILEGTIFTSLALYPEPGLSNIVACRPKTIVLEFMPAYPYVNICYMTLYYVSIAVQNADQYNPMIVHVRSAINTLQEAIDTKNKLFTALPKIKSMLSD